MPAVLTAVIDSTVLVSAFLTEGGVSAELLRYAREGVFLVFLSADILTETQHTLAYPRIRERYPYTDEEQNLQSLRQNSRRGAQPCSRCCSPRLRAFSPQILG